MKKDGNKLTNGENKMLSLSTFTPKNNAAKQLTLEDLFVVKDWVSARQRPTMCFEKYAEDKVYFRTTRSPSAKVPNLKADMITLIFSKKLVEQLNWRENQKLYIGFHPESSKHLMLVQNHSLSSGYILKKGAGGSLMVLFKAIETLNYVPLRECDYLVNPKNKQLMLILDDTQTAQDLQRLREMREKGERARKHKKNISLSV